MGPSILTLAVPLRSQILNLLYLGKEWSHCQETKANETIKRKATHVAMNFDLGHGLDLFDAKTDT